MQKPYLKLHRTLCSDSQTAKLYFKMLKQIGLKEFIMHDYYQNDRCYDTTTDAMLYGMACLLS